MHNFFNNKPSRIFSPAGYLKFIKDEANKNSIARVKFIPPKLGSSGFGKVYVELKYPYRNLHSNI